jgi:nicotinamide-nucleotide amidase
MLGVSQQLLDTLGAVSKPVAIMMAERAWAVSHADIAVAVTGIAGPTGGSEDKPVGTVWLAIATAEKSLATKALYPHGRETFKQLVSQKALDLVRQSLLET